MLSICKSTKTFIHRLRTFHPALPRNLRHGDLKISGAPCACIIRLIMLYLCIVCLHVPMAISLIFKQKTTKIIERGKIHEKYHHGIKRDKNFSCLHTCLFHTVCLLHIRLLKILLRLIFLHLHLQFRRRTLGTEQAELHERSHDLYLYDGKHQCNLG